MVGHTPQDAINCSCGGDVWRIDTGASRWVMGGACQALEISPDGSVRVLGEAGAEQVVASPVEPFPADGPLLTGGDALDFPACDPD